MGKNRKKLKIIVCAGVYFIYTQFICEEDDGSVCRKRYLLSIIGGGLEGERDTWYQGVKMLCQDVVACWGEDPTMS